MTTSTILPVHILCAPVTSTNRPRKLSAHPACQMRIGSSQKIGLEGYYRIRSFATRVSQGRRWLRRTSDVDFGTDRAIAPWCDVSIEIAEALSMSRRIIAYVLCWDLRHLAEGRKAHGIQVFRLREAWWFLNKEVVHVGSAMRCAQARPTCFFLVSQYMAFSTLYSSCAHLRVRVWPALSVMSRFLLCLASSHHLEGISSADVFRDCSTISLATPGECT